MNTGTILCLLLGGFFLLFSLLFAILKEKGTILVSGFNALSQKERELYDKAAISKDMRNQFFLWFVIFAIGALLSFFVSAYLSIIAFIIWLILLIKDVQFDVKKAFEKYKL